MLYHGKHDPAHVLRFVNAPVLEHGPGEGTVLPERQLSNAFGEFAPRDVTGLVESPDDRMKGVQNERVGARVKTRIPLLELVEHIVCKLKFGHEQNVGWTLTLRQMSVHGQT